MAAAAVVTVRLVRSFEHRNFKPVVFHGVLLDQTVQDFIQLVRGDIATRAGLPPPFKKYAYDTMKIIHQAHGSKELLLNHLLERLHSRLGNILLKGIERLWKDLWVAITSLYYNVLHYLEEEGFLSIDNATHLLCCHFVFCPRLQDDLDTFRSGWDNHPIRSESQMTPNQLWVLERAHHPIPGPDNTETNELVMSLEDDEKLILHDGQTLRAAGIANETEVAFFRKEDYGLYKANPKTAW